MALDYWDAEADEKGLLHEKLKGLVEGHEAFLLDEQLGLAREAGIDPSRLPAWNAQTDTLSVVLGNALYSHAERPLAPPLKASGVRGDHDDDDNSEKEVESLEKTSTTNSDGTNAPHRRNSFDVSDARASLAQLMGPATLLGSLSTAPPDERASSRAEEPADTEGNTFFRVMLCLTSAVVEMQALTKDAYKVYLPPLVLFGDDAGADEDSSSGVAATASSAQAANVPPSSAKSKRPSGIDSSASSTSPSPATHHHHHPASKEAEALAGVTELMKGHMQQLWAWQQRAVQLTVYTLRELAALYQDAHCEDKRQSSPYAALTEVRYTLVWQSLADLLGAIAVVEEVFQQHEHFKMGYVRLRKLLAQLCAMANEEEDDNNSSLGDPSFSAETASANASLSGSEKGRGARRRGGQGLLPDGVDGPSLRVLQTVVVRVGDDLLRYGKALRVITEALVQPDHVAAGERMPPFQPFTAPSSHTHAASGASGEPVDPSVLIRFGSHFRGEMLEVLGFMLDNVEADLGTPREASQHQRLPGLIALYALCVNLLKASGMRGEGGNGKNKPNGRSGGGDGGNVRGAELDASIALGKRLFLLHRRAPIVSLQGHYVLTPSLWLARRLPEEMHQILYKKPAPHPMTSTTASIVVVAATQAVTESLRAVQRESAAQFLSNMNRLTTLISAWLADMKTVPLPGVTAAAPEPSAASAGSDSRAPGLNRLDGIASSQRTARHAPLSSRRFVETMVLLTQRGVLLATDLRFTIEQLLALLYCTRTELPEAAMDSVTHGAAMLMMIREGFHAQTGVLASTFGLLTRSIAFVMEKHLHAAHATLYAKAQQMDVQRNGGTGSGLSLFSPNATASRSNASWSRSERSQLHAVEQALLVLQGPITPDSLAALSLLLDVVGNRRRLPHTTTDGANTHASTTAAAPSNGLAITEESREGMWIAFAQLSRMMDYQVTLKAASDCSFLYWYCTDMVPRMFARVYARPHNASRLPYLAAALEEAASTVVLAAKHVPSPQTQLLAPYARFVRENLEAALIAPLCTEVEDDLRLYTHGAVVGQPFRSLNPSSSATCGTPAAAKDLSHFTRLAPFRFFGEWCDVAARVEDHLDAQFYNLNALMPNDWKTYEEMRNLALERYGLHVAVGEGCLPGGIVDQGLDVLVITQDLPLFIAHYTYNLNEQLFIQRPTSTTAKHLHTLHARHIANSIRTHGTGIMNTTVNYVYRCLLKKLSTVSRFLADDVVHSRLTKDFRWIQSQRKALQGADSSSRFVYPMSRANQFNQEMRKLGLAEDGQTFLAKFARLVSEIGNALGYMRLVRSGGLRAIADSAQFLPPVNGRTGLNGAGELGESNRGHTPAAAFSLSREKSGARGFVESQHTSPGITNATTAALAHNLFLPRYYHSMQEDVESSSSDSTRGSSDAETSSSLSSSGDDDDDDGNPNGRSFAPSRSVALAQRQQRRLRRQQRNAVLQQRRRQHLATVDATRNVDRVVNTIQEKLSDGSDYFAILLDAIGSRLGLSDTLPVHAASQEPRGSAEKSDSDSATARGEDANLAHLRLFPLLIPPMCVTFVDGMIREKEQLAKRSQDAIFTDDGFALGCVFLLALFRGQDAFAALHFFEGTRDTYVSKLTALHQAMMEREGLAEQVAAQRRRQTGEKTAAVGASPSSLTRNGAAAAAAMSPVATRYHDRDAEEINSMHLTSTMLDTTLREYAQLEEAFVASNIFFFAADKTPAGLQETRSHGGSRHERPSDSNSKRLNVRKKNDESEDEDR